MPNSTHEKKQKQKKLLEYFAKNLDIKKLSEISARLLGSSSVFMVERGKAENAKSLREELRKYIAAAQVQAGDCCKNVGKAVGNSAQSKKIEFFVCPPAGHGFCLPILDNNDIIAYIVVCGIEIIPSDATTSFFAYFIETTLKGTKKELELDELYKTMKPRAIALSTVHTVHRLISSSLNLNELVSRIARLSMQVIGANRCSVKLLDSRKKTLLPKATVDLRTKKAKLKKVKIGKWAPGKAVKYGVAIRGDRYLATPLIDEDVVGVITLYDKVNGEPFSNFDAEIMRTMAEQAAVAIKNAQLYKEQEKLTMGSIKALAQLIESKTSGICKPKSSSLRIVQLIGQELKIREHELKALQYATLLHDAGELMVPEKVLRKKGRLTEREFRLIKEHPLKGAAIIKSMKSLKSIAPAILYHHENYDGTGYPKGLKGGEIPLDSRIMAVVTSFEAMITKRPYRVTLPINKAIAEIEKNAGKQFDPKVVKAFLKVFKRKDVRNLLRKEMSRVK